MKRPTVSVYNHQDKTKILKEVKLPQVFFTPLRQDIVQFVHDALSKNSRQAHGVDPRAGIKHSAESWGTGRAVARIPRISGSGTHRSGQGAFGNMCRKGHMAFPLKAWRRWHRKVNINERRHALASAIAATSCLPLLQARGHRVLNVPQIPLVLDNEVNKIDKTKQAVLVLNRFGCEEELQRILDGRIIRSGKSKCRGKKYRRKKGPLVVVNDESTNLVRALRNIPGVETVHVKRLNIRLLAPGGQLGRFTIFTQGALRELGAEFGSVNGGALKKGYRLKREVLSNPDISSIINSDEIQSVLRQKRKTVRLHRKQRLNPLRNKEYMDKLNPFAATIRTQKKQKIKKDKKQQEGYKKKAKAFLESIEKKVTDTQNADIKHMKDVLEITKIK